MTQCAKSGPGRKDAPQAKKAATPRNTPVGDPRDELVEHLPALRAFALGLTRNSAKADDLVQGSNTIFVATGVTDGQLVAGVRRERGYVYTERVVLRGASGTLRRIASEHLVSKWL